MPFLSRTIHPIFSGFLSSHVVIQLGYLALILLYSSGPLKAQVMEGLMLPDAPTLTENFGISVEVSGNLAFVGDPDDDNSRGAVYVYQRDSDGCWNRIRKLTAPGGQAGDEYGWSLAKSGKFLIVGARLMDSVNGPDSGTVYVYDISKPSAPPAQLIAPSNFGSIGDEFGYAVDILGTTNPPRAVVGMRLDDSNGETDNGAVVFYEFKAGTWKYQNIVLSPTGSHAHFGSSVSITTNSIGIEVLIGAPQESNGRGAVYFYNFVAGGGWTQNARRFDPNGGVSPRYGISVALDGEFAIIGAHLANVSLADQGAAYVYKRGSLNWPLSTNWDLRALGDSENDQLGISVDIHETAGAPNHSARAVVGVYLDDMRGTDSGAALVLDRSNGGVWTITEHFAVCGAAEQFFGRGVALDVSGPRTQMLVGATKGDVAQVFSLDRSSADFIGEVFVSPREVQKENWFKTYGVEASNTAAILWDIQPGNSLFLNCTTAMKNPRVLLAGTPDIFGAGVDT